MDRLLDGISGGFGGLLLEGEPGIGKTSVWSAGVDEARRRGLRVLLARPAEAEASLAFSGLSDLFGEVADAIGALRESRCRALRAALLLDDLGDSTVNPRGLALAVLDLLRELGEDGPLVIAIDDAQWLDASTRAALTYALRRLTSEPIVFLAATRPDARPLAVEAVERMPLGPIDLAAIDHVVRELLEATLPRPLLTRIHRLSAGNPFYALELARAALRRRQLPATSESLPLPPTLAAAVGERIDALPPEARGALLATAALSSATSEVVVSVAGEGAFAAAVRAQVLAEEDGRVRLAHPLLGSVVYANASETDRRRLHAQLAERVSSTEDRARHLARAVDGIDETVAALLEDAARGAWARGAPEAAAELAELAVELTEPQDADAVIQRRALAGDCVFAAGDAQRAEAILEDVVSTSPPGPRRARVLWRLAGVRAAIAGPAAAYDLYERALSEVGGDDRLAAQIHDRLATWRWIGEGARAAEPHARALVDLAERVGEPALLARALGALLALELVQGRGLDRARYQRMLDLEQRASDHGVELPGSSLHHQMATWAGDYDAARDRLTELLARARERGEAAQILPLWSLAYLDLMTENWRTAIAATTRGLDLVEQVGRAALVPGHVTSLAVGWAHLGEADKAISAADRAIALAERSKQEIHALIASSALALLELSRGDTKAARERYVSIAEAVQRRGETGIGEFWLPDEIEARVAENDLDGAALRLHGFENDSLRSGLPRFLALSARCRALIAYGHGRVNDALADLDAALAHHRDVEAPYQLGRTLFVLGSIQRRENHKALAAQTLTDAAAQFVTAGAALWAERARTEHARIGGRPVSPGRLTPTEQQIAELVAAGRSNAQVARTLSISPRTVEWNLTKIYRKLRVGSRAELAAKFARNR